ncbi:hypothetical protein GQ457_09G016190 [Hibiscus cannabinus]
MSNNTISLRSLLEKENSQARRKEYVIEEAVPNDPGPNAPRADKDKFKKHMDDMLDVGCLMLATMTPELQKQHEDMVAYEMIQNLKEIYEGHARQERYETSKALFQCKMSEGSPVGAHVIKMMGYIQTLEKLGFALNDELAIDVVLQSLPDSFSQFILNFNMNEIEKTLPQLLGMLRTAEGNMKKGGSKSVLMVREAKERKKVAKSKGNGKTKPKGKEALKPKGGVSKDGKCFHCGKTGHWKETARSILRMSRRLKQLEHQFQGLHTRRTLAKGDVDLRVGNGARVAALAVGIYIGFEIIIKNNNYDIQHKYQEIKTNDSNQTYLWHCRLGHISERRISKLHKEGLLDPLFLNNWMYVNHACWEK